MISPSHCYLTCLAILLAWPFSSAQAAFPDPAEAFAGMPADDALVNLPLAIETFQTLLSQPASILAPEGGSPCNLPADAEEAMINGPEQQAATGTGLGNGQTMPSLVASQLTIINGPCPADGKLSGLTDSLWTTVRHQDDGDSSTLETTKERGLARYDEQGNPVQTLRLIQESFSQPFGRDASGELNATPLFGIPPVHHSLIIIYGDGYMNQPDDIMVVYSLFNAPPPNSTIPTLLTSMVSINRPQGDGTMTDMYVNNKLHRRVQYNADDQYHGWTEYFPPMTPAYAYECYQNGELADNTLCGPRPSPPVP